MTHFLLFFYFQYNMDTFPIEVLANIFAFLGSDFVFLFFFLNPLRFFLARESDTKVTRAGLLSETAKISAWPVTGFGNKGPLKVLNGTKLILDDHGHNLSRHI